MQDTGDYISREAILALAESEEYLTPDGDEIYHEYIPVSAVKSLPAADVRPVVLCRDCDAWNDWDSAGKESLGNFVCSCAHWSVEDGPVLYTRPEDFCSYGEKREES